MSIEAKLLLGWMTRETAILWLTHERVPPLTEQEAEALWTQYYGRVEALPPEPHSVPQKLNEIDKETRLRFLRHCREQGKHEIGDVIKLDLATLPIRQFRIVIPKSRDYEPLVNTRQGWVARALPTTAQEPNLQARYSQSGSDTEAWIDLPHGEFMFPFSPNIGGFQVKQGDRWVEAIQVEQRHLLWAGYHRSLARLVNTIGDGNERSALVALTKNRLLDTPNQSADNAHARALCLRARPALLKDFLNDELCITLNLKKQKWLYHVKGEVVAIEDPT